MNAVIVTGVSRGLGAALAQRLLSRRFHVVGVGRSANATLHGERYRFVECDLSKAESIAPALSPTLRELAAARPVAVTLVNNAAVAWPVGRVGHLDDGEAAAAMAINVLAPLVVANVFLRIFASGEARRRIINVSSGAAQTPIAGSAAYCMAKAGLEMLTRTITAEHSAPDVQCISLRPGILETDMQTYMRSHDAAHFPSVGLFRGFKENALLRSPADVAARIVERLIEGEVEQGRTYSHNDLG